RARTLLFEFLQELADRLEVPSVEGAVVAFFDFEERLRRAGASVIELLPVVKGDDRVVRGVADQDGLLVTLWLGQVVVAVGLHPLGREDWEQLLGHRPDAGEGAEQDKSPVGVLGGKLASHGTTEGLAHEEDSLAGDMLGLDEPVVGGVGSGVAAGLTGAAGALA